MCSVTTDTMVWHSRNTCLQFRMSRNVGLTDCVTDCVPPVSYLGEKKWGKESRDLNCYWERHQELLDYILETLLLLLMSRKGSLYTYTCLCL